MTSNSLNPTWFKTWKVQYSPLLKSFPKVHLTSLDYNSNGILQKMQRFHSSVSCFVILCRDGLSDFWYLLLFTSMVCCETTGSLFESTTATLWETDLPETTKFIQIYLQ